MHSGLNLPFNPVYRCLTDEKLNNYRNQFSDLHICIIDEISMVPADKIYDAHRRFREIFINHDIFGGLGFMFVGDLMQLGPVQARRVFSKPQSIQHQALFNTDDNIWDNCQSIILKQNKRQGEGNPWTNCLNNLRFVNEKLSPEDEILLESRRISHFPLEDFSSASHVFYTNKEVEALNTEKLNALKTKLINIESKIQHAI